MLPKVQIDLSNSEQEFCFEINFAAEGIAIVPSFGKARRVSADSGVVPRNPVAAKTQARVVPVRSRPQSLRERQCRPVEYDLGTRVRRAP